MKKEFPNGFLWGGATSAAQLEGGFDEGGRGPSHLDYLKHIPLAERNGRSLMQITEEEYLENKAQACRGIWPSAAATIFIIISRKISVCSVRWGLRHSGCR